MKNKNYLILFPLIFSFGILHICAGSERPFHELKSLVESFFYCFDGKPGIIYYRKFFNKYSSELYNSELYRDRDRDAVLKKQIEQKAHDKAIQTIKEERYFLREQIMKSSGYGDYVEQLGAARQYREKCYKEVLHAENLVDLLYTMLSTLQSANFSKVNIDWELKQAIKNVIKIDNPETSVSENNKAAEQIINKLGTYEKRKIMIRKRAKVYKKEMAAIKEQKEKKKISDLNKAKSLSYYFSEGSKIFYKGISLIKGWFNGWYQQD